MFDQLFMRIKTTQHPGVQSVLYAMPSATATSQSGAILQVPLVPRGFQLSVMDWLPFSVDGLPPFCGVRRAGCPEATPTVFKVTKAGGVLDVIKDAGNFFYSCHGKFIPFLGFLPIRLYDDLCYEIGFTGPIKPASLPLHFSFGSIEVFEEPALFGDEGYFLDPGYWELVQNGFGDSNLVCCGPNMNLAIDFNVAQLGTQLKIPKGYSPVTMPSPAPTKHKCRCDNHTLFNFGCKCGGI